MSHLLKRLYLLLLTAMVLGQPAYAYETDVMVRDPSTIVKNNGVYWIYGTGTGIRQFSSTDRVHWTFRGHVFPTAPAWVADTVPQNTRNNAWAPDIRFFSGKWHLYYCYSTIGSKVSGIGVATNTTLDPATWVDNGIVVRTGTNTNYNALDPCIFEDVDHGIWLSFGSYFSGIKLIRIDPVNGKPDAANSTIFNIATRPGKPINAVEASAIIYHDGYYYLFVNWDGCCAGARSTYNIRMGRSRTVTGPYRDQAGKDMEAGGGTLFLGSISDNGSGRLCDDEIGPGHFGLLHDENREWVSFHEEWARDKNGATTVNILPLAWDSDGWPRATLEPGPYKLVSNLATHDLATPTAKGLHTWPDEGASTPRWTFQYQGDGFYSILGAASRSALTAVNKNAVAGSLVTLAPFTKQPGQLWYLRQNDNGTYTLLPKSGGQTVALDVGGCNLSDDAPIGLWIANGEPCQEWSFHVR